MNMEKNYPLFIGLGLLIVVVAGVLLMRSPAPATTTDTQQGTVDTTTTTTGADTTGGQTGAAKRIPGASTTGFASVASTTAFVVGTVMPGGAATTYWFEYGPTMSYGSKSEIESAPANFRTIATAAYLSGLKPGTQYYFRIGAKNAYGTAYGSVYSFITPAK